MSATSGCGGSVGTAATPTVPTGVIATGPSATADTAAFNTPTIDRLAGRPITSASPAIAKLTHGKDQDEMSQEPSKLEPGRITANVVFLHELAMSELYMRMSAKTEGESDLDRRFRTEVGPPLAAAMKAPKTSVLTVMSLLDPSGALAGCITRSWLHTNMD